LSSEDLAYLADMVESADLALSYLDQMSFEAFRADQKTQDAVLYRLGILGEAARFVSEPTRNALNLDWSAITGMRHRLFHGYREVKLRIVWTTVTDDLAPLVERLTSYLAENA